MNERFTVQVQDVFLYSWRVTALAVACIVLAAAVFLFVFFRFRAKKREKPILPAPPAPVNLPALKNRYLNALQGLRAQTMQRGLPERQAYLQLSEIIRQFVFEATGIAVQNYSYREIETLGIGNLTALVAEYYVPEFAYASEADFVASLARTESLIQNWFRVGY